MPTTQAVTEPVLTAGSREAMAETAARTWVMMIDKGQYADSWKATSPLFQATSTSDLWVASLQTNRAPLSKVNSRKLASATYTKSVTGGAGEFIVVHYTTSFANAQAPFSDEAITVVKDADGQWRVAGYGIK